MSKSYGDRDSLAGMAVFAAAFKPRRTLLVGAEGVPLDEFLASPVANWLKRV